MTTIGVECTFEADGAVRVRRVRLGDRWHIVGQGRQWIDAAGRHVLVMFAGDEVRELLLRREGLIWEIVPARRPTFMG